MDLRSLEELRQADERKLRVTSLGLATGGKLRPEDAALHQQEAISHAELRMEMMPGRLAAPWR